MWNVVPTPTVLVMPIVPLCRSRMMRFTTARPRPVPRDFVEKNGSRIFARFSGGMPAARIYDLEDDPFLRLHLLFRSKRQRAGLFLAHTVHRVADQIADNLL